MNKETEPRNSAKGNNIIWPAFCLLCLALVALPVFCSLSSGKKNIRMTNEEIILNWMDRTRMGKNLIKAGSAHTVRSGVGVAIREDQIKAVDKDDGGWVVTTRGNRLHFVPKTFE